MPLEQQVQELGLTLTPDQLDQLRRLTAELVDWNGRMNLTSITDPAEVDLKHHLDSLTVALAVPPKALAHAAVVDIGAGAGFPGLPLKIALPSMQLALVEATAKKAAFLHHMVDVLGLRGVDIVNARAEDAGRQFRMRGRFDVALARAVGSMAEIVELAVPFCRVGGLVVAHKKGDIDAEVAGATRAMKLVGARLRGVVPVPLPALPDDRKLVVIEKVIDTPFLYPRRPGVPHKTPL